MLKMISLVSQEIYIAVILLAIAYYVFSNISSINQIATIIVILLSFVYFYYLYNLSLLKETGQENINIKHNKDIEDRNEVSGDLFMLYKFPKKMKFLKLNEDFVKVVENIRFIRKFSKSRYSDILLNMNLLMKIYIYILSDRYEPDVFIPQYIDTRDNILDLLYSLIIIVPSELKHTYNVDPHLEIQRSIDDFVIKSREMLNIIEKFSKIQKKKEYIPDTVVKPYNEIKPYNFP